MAYKMRISDWSSDVCSSDLQAAIAVRQLEAGGVLEGLQGTAFDLAGIQQHVELAQRGVAIDGFEVVVGAEQPLPASLTLALSDGAERVEAAGDGREEALLRLHVGGDRPEQRRLHLVGAVGSAEALDRRIRLPAGFEQIVDPEPAVPRAEIGVVTATGAAGVAEHADAQIGRAHV